MSILFAGYLMAIYRLMRSSRLVTRPIIAVTAHSGYLSIDFCPFSKCQQTVCLLELYTVSDFCEDSDISAENLRGLFCFHKTECMVVTPFGNSRRKLGS